jgi:hypothetical protein
MRPLVLAVALPFLQAWSDTGLISRDDDWTGVPGVVGYRGDGLTAVAGEDPRSVVADGSGTPVDVNANETDPRAVGLAAGVTEFELPDPVVALQGSATAAAPHLVLSVDTLGRSKVTVRYRLRDIDASSIANAVQPVALQYRVGTSGDFVAVPGGFVEDATTGPGQATLATPVSAVLPVAADDKPLVQLRILTTNAVGQDEWVGVDDIEVEAGGEMCTPPEQSPPSGTPPGGPPAPPSDGPSPTRPPSSGPPPQSSPSPRPRGPLPPPAAAPALSGLTLSPATFAAARRGPAVSRTGRAGASLRFRLPRPARVEFRVTTQRLPGPQHSRAHRGAVRAPDRDQGRTPDSGVHTPHREQGRTPGGGVRAPHPLFARTPAIHRELGRFSIRGRRGVNRLRFHARLRGRPLPPGLYRLTARAIDRNGLASPPESTGFRIRSGA